MGLPEKPSTPSLDLRCSFLFSAPSFRRALGVWGGTSTIEGVWGASTTCQRGHTRAAHWRGARVHRGVHREEAMAIILQLGSAVAILEGDRKEEKKMFFNAYT